MFENDDVKGQFYFPSRKDDIEKFFDLSTGKKSFKT